MFQNRLAWAILIPFLALVWIAPFIGTSTLVQAEHDLVIVRVEWHDRNELNHLISTYDVWEVDPDEQVVFIGADSATVTFLQETGWQAVVDDAQTEFHLRRPLELKSRSAESFFGGYKNNAEILAELQSLNAQYPHLTELYDYGDSLCKIEGGCTTPGEETLPGHDLIALRISNEAISGTSQISGTTIISGSKPVFMLHAGVHARELASPETALRFARWLLENYRGSSADSPTINPIVDWQESWIVPIANPDGYDVVYLGTQAPYNGLPLLHRKNGRGAADGNCSWPSNVGNQFGVDLNRNHSFGWGPITGTSTNPCEQSYRGEGSASEPETAAFENLISSLIPDQRGPNRTDVAPSDTTGFMITVHSYGNKIIWPWGDGVLPDSTAPNETHLKAIGDRMAVDSGYESIKGNNFGAVAGATEDHVYGTLGIPSYTFEIGTTFLQDFVYTQNRIWDENRPMLIYAASIARTPYQTVNGPELSNLTYTIQDSGVIISGTVSDSKNGSHPISSVKAQLNAPFPLVADFTYTATPLDGTFDTTTEQFVIGPIPFVEGAETEEQCPQIDIYLHGSDQEGEYGPVRGVIAQSSLCRSRLTFYFPFFATN